MRLPIPLTPNEQESLAGYLWRLSEANGYGGVDHMRRVYNKVPVLWRSLHRPYPGQFSEEKLIPHLVMMTELDGYVFRKTLFDLLPGKNELDHPVDSPLLDWRVGFTRICPDCLKETGIMPKEWELMPFSVCPLHLIWL